METTANELLIDNRLFSEKVKDFRRKHKIVINRIILATIITVWFAFSVGFMTLGSATLTTLMLGYFIYSIYKLIKSIVKKIIEKNTYLSLEEEVDFKRQIIVLKQTLKNYLKMDGLSTEDISKAKEKFNTDIIKIKENKSKRIKELIELKTKRKKKIDPTRKQDTFLGAFIWIVPALIILILFTYTPLFIVVANAFDDHIGLEGKSFKFTLSHFLGKNGLFGMFGTTFDGKGLFELPSWWVAVSNSVSYAFISVPIGIALSLLISVSIASIAPKRLRAVFQTLFFLPYVTSAVAVSLAFAQIFGVGDLTSTSILNQILGWFGSGTVDLLREQPLVAILIFGIWKSLPFNIIILTAAILGMDNTTKKAASIDGAGKVRMFFYITVPLLLPTIIYLVTVGFMGALKVFPLALFGNNPQQAITVGGQTVVLYIFNAVSNNWYGRAGAASVSLLVIVLLITKFNRWIRRKVKW